MLFCGAERVLARDGVSGLTSRAITTEAGVAKGVMHHHFADFDEFLAELIIDRTLRLEGLRDELNGLTDANTVAKNLATALAKLFTPLAVDIVCLVITRGRLRARLREAGSARFPLLSEGSDIIAAYLKGEQARRRIPANVDVSILSHSLIGSVHLLYTESEERTPDKEEISKVVAALVGKG